MFAADLKYLTMNKEEIVSEVGRPVLRTLGFMQGGFLLLFISSPFVCIWGSWTLAWKLALSGLIGILLIKFIYKIAKQTIDEAVDECLNELKNNKPKSSFQQRLAEMQSKYKS